MGFIKFIVNIFFFLYQVSQVTKPSVESNEEQSTDSKHFKGISNRGFLKAESLPEMNIFQEHSPSNLSVNISTDTDQQNLNKVKGKFLVCLHGEYETEIIFCGNTM